MLHRAGADFTEPHGPPEATLGFSPQVSRTCEQDFGVALPTPTTQADAEVPKLVIKSSAEMMYARRIGAFQI
jgi:hypothetical protein